MARSIALLAVLAGAAVAADSSSTMSVMLVGENGPVYGSVLGADSTAVTFKAGCGTDEACDDIWEGKTVKQGPSTFSIAGGATKVGTATGGLDCALDPKVNLASCTVTLSAEDKDGHHAHSKAQTVLSNYQQVMFPVTLTAGLEKFSSASAATPASAASGPSSTISASASGRSGQSSASASSSASSSRTDSAARAPAATQKAVLAGVAAIVGGAMAL
ncbi:hypothetical protein HRG_006851 [Hirsutella rhossiliensis]|uniref:GPI anchored cell wall protein n=1 Tax=Hirsutella rhossiliensis TaxID=111463 RepID=A0A9P8SGG8_9HYPO|nr:uncharacterized protein HRG_06851 [Hirsutella rhossiliensis]KAH0961771.1 hypothetical protein HRG_06851 [Hirsutella rhossiliensis]